MEGDVGIVYRGGIFMSILFLIICQELSLF